MLLQILKTMGLTEKEAAAYLALLHTGPAPISLIANRIGKPRSSGYTVLKKLIKKGFASNMTRAHTMIFTALAPGQLKDILQQRQESLTHQITLLEGVLPQFQALINPGIPLPKVTFYEGITGVKKIYQDILKSTAFAEETKALVTLEHIAPELKEWIFHRFTPQKIKRKIFSQVILSTRQKKQYIRLDQKHLRETRSIPFYQFPFRVEIDLYGENKIALISFASEELFGLIIESKNIFQTLDSLFRFMWKSLR